MGDGEQATKTLVWISGPPAVGKMTVGLELSRITGLPLFHNHLSIEAVLPVFEFGSPPFSRLVSQFRDAMFVEAARSSLPGLIFTWVWAFDQPSDLHFVETQKAVFEAEGGRAVFVELTASLETRLARNVTEPRLSSKPSKRDTEASRKGLIENDQTYQLDSNGDFPFAEYLRIDNTSLEPLAVARQIAAHFGLSTLEADS